MVRAGCVAFLKEVLPRLGLSWRGFRRVDAQVCKRIRRRFLALGLADLAAYRSYFEKHPAEWDVLQSLCHITISRFWRDRAVFDRLAAEIVPQLAGAAASRGDTMLRAWSAGCASGEEPYSLKLLWEFLIAPKYPGIAISIVATDADTASLLRARTACYRVSSLRELSDGWIRAAFDRQGPLYCLRESFRTNIAFREEDIRVQAPEGPFDLILCRNLAFTYFERAGQEAALNRMVAELRLGGALIVGRGERLPPHDSMLEDWRPGLGIYRKQRE